MGKITNTNCGVCWLNDKRQIPSDWAHVQGRDVDFYCGPHLVIMEIPKSECMPITEWKRREANNPQQPEPARLPAIQALPHVSNDKPLSPDDPTPLPRQAHEPRLRRVVKEKPQKKGNPTCRTCKKNLRRGWPHDRCKGCLSGEGTQTVAKPQSTPQARPNAQDKGNGNGTQVVAGIEFSIMGIEEYREKFPMRNTRGELDPIVALVKQMAPGKAAKLSVPKGHKVKTFRDRVSKVLHRHNLKVTVEQNQVHNCIAVICGGA